MSEPDSEKREKLRAKIVRRIKLLQVQINATGSQKTKAAAQRALDAGLYNECFDIIRANNGENQMKLAALIRGLEKKLYWRDF